ncbi:MAG: FAD-dependent oxidoreductase [Bacilli bacterium]|nr:FAD-dependent oxidoreductase [Bacilli bacterium]
MYDIIIIGAGPAGMTSALYALRANKKVLVLESNTYGGQIVNASNIANYPALPNISGFDYATNLYNQIKELGVQIKFETVIRITKEKTVITSDNEYNAKAIILATGTQKKKLNIAKESDFIGKGVSYCATCDGNFYKNKEVAVVGATDHAIEDAIYLNDIASKVYLINDKDIFDCDESLVDELNNKKNIEIKYNSSVVGLHGNPTLSSIDVKGKDDNEVNIPINGLFVAVGQSPKNEIFSNVVDLTENGYIKSNDGVHTKTPGIYVAGDAREKILRQLVTAASDGAIAATTAIKEMF